MNKISGILPANSRVTTVDMKNSGVARPGSPSFGREIGVSSVVRRKSDLETAQKANSEFLNQTHLRNTQEDPKAKIVQDMADRFFQNKNRELQNEVNLGLDSSTDMVIESDPIDLSDTISPSKEMVDTPIKSIVTSENRNDIEAKQDDDAPAVGSYLDVRA